MVIVVRDADSPHIYIYGRDKGKEQNDCTGRRTKDAKEKRQLYIIERTKK